MINAVTEQFSRFVNFAQERFDAGKMPEFTIDDFHQEEI